ncbi:MAG: glycosyltransferase [Proteobacteria bacterium]|nr:glycosyltransferase [Pseudomonadota bacterium]
MKVRILTRDNGFGLSRDLRRVADALAEAGMQVEPLGMGGDHASNALRAAWLRLLQGWHGAPEIQVFLERTYPRCLLLAPCNVLIPNPEWTGEDAVAVLPRFDAVLCKTRHAVDIFAAQGCATHYIGFSSDDRLDKTVPRERGFFHLAGRSAAKGTQAVLEAWRRHPEWPVLTVVQDARTAQPGAPAANIVHRVEHIDDGLLRTLQNRHQFHLCPSEAEGFGHYIVEALSVGAIVLTTDGAPMNELVTPDRGLLIEPARTARLNLSPQYFVSVEAIEAAVERALALDAQRLAVTSAAARAFFVAGDRAFRQRLPDAVREAVARKRAG